MKNAITPPSFHYSTAAPKAFGAGGAEGVRTPDLLNAIQALYQLSYDPIGRARNLKSHPRLSNFLPSLQEN
jgi:hypothetical protein